MSKLRLAVLFGGCSPEYGVSLQSAYSVFTHLNPQKYDVIPLGITRDGRWFWYTGSYDAILDDTWHTCRCVPAIISPDRDFHGLLILDAAGPSSLRLDAAFPVLHGKNGEDGTVQGLLELAGIPIVGCGVLASALCMDKELAHQVAAAAGVPVPPSVVFRAGEDVSRLRERTAGLSRPLFVKPARAGSSFGITRVTEPSGLIAAVSAALEYDDKVVIEEGIPGYEVGCAVLGRGSSPFTGRPDEIELQGRYFDFTEKYNLLTARIHTPARVSPDQEREIQAMARRVYLALDCAGLARVDLFLTPDGRLIFNEVNTIPGFTGHSRYPSMMEAAGLPLPLLLDRLVETAVGA